VQIVEKNAKENVDLNQDFDGKQVVGIHVRPELVGEAGVDEVAQVHGHRVILKNASGVELPRPMFFTVDLAKE
jgi:hypothetical protein